jgi:glycosyltransferase involved in cell wall biosynthesis
VCSWWRAVHGTEAPSEWREYRRRVRAGLRAADVVIAPTSAMRDALELEHGRLPRTQVIANGRRRQPPAQRPTKEPLVLTAGRIWDPAKNITTLCAAAGSIAWPVYIAGDRLGPDGRQAECEGVQHLGHLPPESLAAWMNRAAIYALPARYEPFGLSALEAALAGCALVLGDIPSLREVWGSSAVFVAPDDAGALAHAVGSLMHDERRRTEASDRARSRAEQLTPERMAAKYHASYDELLRPAVVSR